jgi:hypothetical protein
VNKVSETLAASAAENSYEFITDDRAFTASPVSEAVIVARRAASLVKFRASPAATTWFDKVW